MEKSSLLILENGDYIEQMAVCSIKGKKKNKWAIKLYLESVTGTA